MEYTRELRLERREDFMTLAERMRREGMEKGRKEGREEERKEAKCFTKRVGHRNNNRDYRAFSGKDRGVKEKAELKSTGGRLESKTAQKNRSLVFIATTISYPVMIWVMKEAGIRSKPASRWGIKCSPAILCVSHIT
ncbi:hypothetical protein [Thermosyntropha lipolytica]|nr:hypothetical protein [Thermosyntropha lipolytica]